MNSLWFVVYGLSCYKSADVTINDKPQTINDKMDKALLPAGFHDLLYPEAGKKAGLMARLFSGLHKFGYELVEPPVIEFENSLFTGAGSALKDKTFRVMDPVSHKMMGVRSDITTQVARIAATRLKKAPKPLRLAYGGDVFRVKGEGLYAERQLTQAGIELVGVDSAAADAEVVLVSIAALKELGLQGICVDFTLPSLIGIILGGMKLKKDEKSTLLEAINKKNIKEIEKLAGSGAKLLVKLASSGITAKELQKIDLPSAAKPLCERLGQVIEILEKSGEDIQISIDPSESSKFSYHSGIGFTIFAKGVKSEVGRGGRYEIADDSEVIPAVGATIYINELLRVLPAEKQPEKIFVPLGCGWRDIRNLAKKEGMIVIPSVSEVKDVKKEAKIQGCSFIFDGGKIIKI